MSMNDQPVPKIVSSLLIPYILVFGLYVQFHGDFGPGGGFQAGVIFAAGIILYALVFGLDKAQTLVAPWLLKRGAALGLMLYISVGLAGILLGGRFLNYNVLAHDPVHGQHYGILLVEAGVGLTVACVMLIIYYSFVGRANEVKEGVE